MKLNLSKVELRVLKVLCSNSFSASGLAAELGVKPAFVSRLLHSLSEKGLINVQKQGTQKQVSLSEASHAQAFKRLFSSRPQLDIENWLSGKAITILVPLTPEIKLNQRELLQESNCSLGTFLNVKKKLGAVGALIQVNDKNMIPDPLVKEFIIQYADNLQLILQKELAGFTVAKRFGNHVVIRTESPNVPEYFVQTGINRLVEEGLQIIETGRNEYYFNLNEEKRKISTEEAVIHALTLSILQSRSEFIIIGIFLKQHSFLNTLLLSRTAKKYEVEKELTEIRRTLDLSEKLREYNA